jgi:hypothetical protein
VLSRPRAYPTLNFRFFWEPLPWRWSRLGGQPLNRPEMVGVDDWNSGVAKPAPSHD